MFEKELEFDLRLLKALIKIAKARNEKTDFAKFLEQLRESGDVDTAFALGILAANYSNYLSEQVCHNYVQILLKLKENKSEEEILKEFEKAFKEKRFEEFVMYGG